MSDWLPPAPITILTGGAGWFGRAFLSALTRDDPGLGPVQRDGEIRVLVAAAADVDAVLQVLPTARVFVADIADVSRLGPLFADAAGASVVHAAGVIHPRRVGDFERVNAGGTANVVDRARRAGARRLVHVSSNSPFGTNPRSTDVFRHDEPYRPGPGYGVSKMHAEETVRRANDPAGDRGAALETVVIRPPWFYGPWQPLRQTTFFRLVRTGRFPLLGNGEQRRSMVYVDNLVQAVARAERAVGAAGEVCWAADARPYPMAEVIDTVRAALEAEGYEVSAKQRRLPAVLGRVADRADRVLQARGLYRQELHVLGEMDKTIACDISHTREVLGYDPEIELLEGMRRSIRWVREQGVEI